MGLEELEVQKGEISIFSSMPPPVEKQELVFTIGKTKSVYFDSNGS